MLSITNINVKHIKQLVCKNVNMSLQNRINELLQECPKKKAIDLARFAKVSRATVSGWTTGKTTTIEGANAFSVAKFFGVNAEWVQTGNGKKYPETTNKNINKTENNEINDISYQSKNNDPIDPGERYLPIKMGSFKLQAGFIGFVIEWLDDEENEPIYFKAEWLRKKGYRQENLVAAKVQGDSMIPSLYHGDTVIVNTAEKNPKDGKVFAINYEGELLIKRMIRDNGQWWIVSDNSDKTRYPKKLCTNDICIVIGMIVHKQSNEI